MNIALERLLQKLRVRYVAPLRRAFDSFWSWWRAELIALLPENIREVIAQGKQRAFVELDGADVVVRQGTPGQTREVVRRPLDSPDDPIAGLPQNVWQTIVLMPSDKVLARSLSLPLAAEENLREVLAFEMDRHTPFSATQVYYDFTVTKRASGQQEFSLDLVYSPRNVVDQLLDNVARHGVRPDVVTSRGSEGELRPVNLLPANKRQNKRKAARRQNIVLAALAMLLFITAVALPLVQKEQVVRALEAELQNAVAEAKESTQLRQDVETLAEGSRLLMEKKQSNILIIQVIDEVSRILPDHTWLNRLDIAGDEIQVQGQSSSAAALIALIESSPMLHNARFRSPVIQVPRTNEERFHLSANINWNQAP
jgi:general secretion pathway protein L